jgi:hypothetical protein
MKPLSTLTLIFALTAGLVQCARSQQPRLRIEPAKLVAWDSVEVIMQNDGRLVLSGMFPDPRRGTDQETVWTSQLLRLDRDGRLLQRLYAPQIDAFPSPMRFEWTCRSVFADDSMLVEVRSIFGSSSQRVWPVGASIPAITSMITSISVSYRPSPLAHR